MADDNKKYPEGHFVGMWMGIGIALFTGLGVPISITTGNFAFMGIGPALGVSIGLSIGSSVEAKYKKEGKIRPLTEKEEKRKKMALTLSLVVLLIGVIAGFLAFLFVT